jgi:hypothetical protein
MYYSLIKEIAPEAMEAVEDAVAGGLDMDVLMPEFDDMGDMPDEIAYAIQQAVGMAAQRGMARRSGGAMAMDKIDYYEESAIHVDEPLCVYGWAHRSGGAIPMAEIDSKDSEKWLKSSKCGWGQL